MPHIAISMYPGRSRGREGSAGREGQNAGIRRIKEGSEGCDGIGS